MGLIAQTAYYLYYLGFNDPAYFSRFFTKATGQSPRPVPHQAEQLARGRPKKIAPTEGEA